MEFTQYVVGAEQIAHVQPGLLASPAYKNKPPKYKITDKLLTTQKKQSLSRQRRIDRSYDVCSLTNHFSQQAQNIL